MLELEFFVTLLTALEAYGAVRRLLERVLGVAVGLTGLRCGKLALHY